MRNSLAFLVASALSAGCGTPAYIAPSLPEVTRLAAHKVDVRFSTDVPEAYYVTSGPAEAQAAFPVNDRLRDALGEYARSKSNAAGESVVTVEVHLVRVRTGYREIGAPLGNRRRPMVPASGIEASLHAPAEIIKQVELTLTADIEVGRRQVRKESIRALAVRTIDRHRFDAWSYDYGDVIEAAIGNAIEHIDRIVGEGLATSEKGRSPALDGGRGF